MKSSNRLNKLFQNKDSELLSVFFTAGYPKLESTVEIIKALAEGNVDMVEIGIPFSDPMADGPVIQASSSKALENGMNLHLLLQQVKLARAKVADMPFILMGYLNPVMQFGFESFFETAANSGVDALIIPDLPFDLFLSGFKSLSRKYNIPMIMLITPETSEERIKQIDEHCDGFIYMVSAASTTGAKDAYGKEQIAYFERINKMQLKHKRLIGFGISNHTTFNQALQNSSGAIIGSHFIKCLDSSEGNAPEAVKKMLASIKSGNE